MYVVPHDAWMVFYLFGSRMDVLMIRYNRALRTIELHIHSQLREALVAYSLAIGSTYI